MLNKEFFCWESISGKSSFYYYSYLEGTFQKTSKPISHNGLYYMDKIWTVSWKCNDKENIYIERFQRLFSPKENELIVGQFSKIGFDIYWKKSEKTNLHKIDNSRLE